MQDRRAARRYELSLPIVVRVSPGKEAASWTGKTLDISNRGVCFTIGHSLSTGTELELTMILPTKVTGGTQVFIRGIGRVTGVGQRESKGDQSVAVGAVFERYEITRNEPAGA